MKLVVKVCVLLDSMFWVFVFGLLMWFFMDFGIGFGVVVVIVVGVWCVWYGDMSFEVLLIVLMVGSEIFWLLCDLCVVLY